MKAGPVTAATVPLNGWFFNTDTFTHHLYRDGQSVFSCTQEIVMETGMSPQKLYAVRMAWL